MHLASSMMMGLLAWLLFATYSPFSNLRHDQNYAGIWPAKPAPSPRQPPATPSNSSSNPPTSSSAFLLPRRQVEKGRRERRASAFLLFHCVSSDFSVWITHHRATSNQITAQIFAFCEKKDQSKHGWPAKSKTKQSWATSGIRPNQTLDHQRGYHRRVVSSLAWRYMPLPPSGLLCF